MTHHAVTILACSAVNSLATGGADSSSALLVARPFSYQRTVGYSRDAGCKSASGLNCILRMRVRVLSARDSKMRRSSREMGTRKKSRVSQPGTVTLKAVADRVGLAPGTVSAVLNDAPSARSIPERTQLRIQAAARELNYRPNFFARSLRKKRTYTIGLIVEEIGDAYGSMIISGVEGYLRRRNYFFLTVIHRHDLSILLDYSRLLLERGVEAFITLDTSLQEPPPLPTVSVAGHRALEGVTNIVLDQETGVRLALKHLVALGHRQLGFATTLGSCLQNDSRARLGDGSGPGDVP